MEAATISGTAHLGQQRHQHSASHKLDHKLNPDNPSITPISSPLWAASPSSSSSLLNYHLTTASCRTNGRSRSSDGILRQQFVSYDKNTIPTLATNRGVRKCSVDSSDKKQLTSYGNPSAMVNVNDIAAGLASAVAAAVADAVTVATISRNLNLNLNSFSHLRQQLEMQNGDTSVSRQSNSNSTSSPGVLSATNSQLKLFLSGSSENTDNRVSNLNLLQRRRAAGSAMSDVDSDARYCVSASSDIRLE